MGAKSKPQKIRGPKVAKPISLYFINFAELRGPGIRGCHHKSSHFSLPQKIPEWKISNPKKSFDHPHDLKSGIPPPPSLGLGSAGDLLCKALWSLLRSHLPP